MFLRLRIKLLIIQYRMIIWTVNKLWTVVLFLLRRLSPSQRLQSVGKIAALSSLLTSK